MNVRCLFAFGVFIGGTVSVNAQGVPNAPSQQQAPAKSGDSETKTVALPVGIPEPTISRICAPDAPHIGDLIKCEVSVEHGAEFSVQISVPGSWEGAAQLPAQRSPDHDRLVSKRMLTTRWLSMRKVKLHGFHAQWRHRDGATGELTLPDEFVAMHSVMANMPDPEFRFFRSSEEKIEPFWSRHGGLPLLETNWILLILMASALMGLIWQVTYTYWKRRRERLLQAAAPWVDPRPAHVIALASLDELANKEMPENGLTLEFYLSLSQILRTYLENRYGLAILRGVDARGLETGLRFRAATTEEIQHAFQNHTELSPDALSALDECLGIIDYVVFGGMRPHVGQTETDRRLVRNFVFMTQHQESDANQTGTASDTNEGNNSTDLSSSETALDEGVETKRDENSSAPNQERAIEQNVPQTEDALPFRQTSGDQQSTTKLESN